MEHWVCDAGRVNCHPVASIDLGSLLPDYLWIALVVLALAGLWWVMHKLSGVVRYVPNGRVGIVERLWSPHGSVGDGRIIALHGEAGYQPHILRGGMHFFFPFMYRIHLQPLVTISLGTIAYVFARDGEPLPPTQTLGRVVPIDDVAEFLANGGQRGPQRLILREGTYAINTAQFVILASDGVHGLNLSSQEEEMLDGMRRLIEEREGFRPVSVDKDSTGIVTVHDGPPMPSGDIVAPEVEGHRAYQDPEAFLAAGGLRGRQLQVLVDGTYYVNRLFATVEMCPKQVIDVGSVGVVVYYAGTRGEDISGSAYQHGELVANGWRGVWVEPLLPGKYAWNPYAGKIYPVPTTNFVLKWISGIVGGYKLDENLSEIELITKDAFEPRMPLSVVVHIDYREAPKLIQRFGDVKRLVESTLDPMVSAYFKDIGQRKTLIELLQQRGEIQATANEEMRERFAAYSINMHEVLIGTPSDPEGRLETILVQLRNRQIATEQQETYRLQEEAANKERTLNSARASAVMQEELTRSEISIRVNENAGSADLARATKDAERVRITAEAEARRIFLTGEATAQAAKLQVDAYGGPEYRLTEQVAGQFFEAIRQGHQPVVPQVLVSGGAAEGSLGALLSGLISSTMLNRGGDSIIPFKSAAE